MLPFAEINNIHPFTQTTKFHAHEIKLFHKQFVSALFNKHIIRKTNISEEESIENSLTQLGLGRWPIVSPMRFCTCMYDVNKMFIVLKKRVYSVFIFATNLVYVYLLYCLFSYTEEINNEDI